MFKFKLSLCLAEWNCFCDSGGGHYEDLSVDSF